ncbi:MAG: SurA N-terminal domain-containing protein [candidate division Zixibacteria bacterium]|nr:SurA N-terminal domain-containing protein [Candidatus Tariuqbacter arcticus]
MMQQMRRNMPLILWILVFAFIATIIFSWGMGGFQEKQKAGIIGVINGQEIKYDYYEQMVQRQVSIYTEQTGSEPVDQTMVDIQNKVWDDIVRNILMTKEAERLGLAVTNAEVADQVLNSPPDFIYQNEYFQTNGQFDIRKYHAFLQNPANTDQVLFLEENYRQTLLERKLLLQVMGSVEVTDWELRRRFEERNTMGKAKFLFFPADSMKADSALVTDDLMQQHYYEHLDDYLVTEKRRIVLVEIENETSHEDSVVVNEMAEEIEASLKDGEDFGFLAAIYSDHHTAPDSGNLDWMPIKQLEAMSDSAVQATEPGNFTGPIINRYGLHFYLVEDRKMIDGELKSKIKIIQLKYMPSADTKDIIRNKAMNFAEEIKLGDFNLIAKAYGVAPDTSGFFDRESGFIPGLGKMKSASEFAFENPLNTTSEVYPIRIGWLVFKLIDIEPQHYKPVDEIKDELFDDICRKMQLEAAKAECEGFYDKLVDKERWVESAESAGLEIKVTENPFRFKDYIKDVGRDYTFTAVLFRAEVGELVGPLMGKQGCYLIELTERTPFDSTEFYSNIDEHLPKLVQKKRELVFTEWYEWLKKRAKIEDYRYLYFKIM